MKPFLVTKTLAFGLFTLILSAVPATAQATRTETKTLGIAVEEVIELCNEPFVTVTSYAPGAIKKDITFWTDEVSGKEIPLFPGTGNPHAMLFGDGSDVTVVDIQPVGALPSTMRFQTFARSEPCPLGYRDCGYARCLAHIFQKCCTGGAGVAVCGHLSPMPFCGVKNGSSACCNLFGDCTHSRFAAGLKSNEIALALIDQIKESGVLTSAEQCNME